MGQQRVNDGDKQQRRLHRPLGCTVAGNDGVRVLPVGRPQKDAPVFQGTLDKLPVVFVKFEPFQAQVHTGGRGRVKRLADVQEQAERFALKLARMLKHRGLRTGVLDGVASRHKTVLIGTGQPMPMHVGHGARREDGLQTFVRTRLQRNGPIVVHVGGRLGLAFP